MYYKHYNPVNFNLLLQIIIHNFIPNYIMNLVNMNNKNYILINIIYLIMIKNYYNIILIIFQIFLYLNHQIIYHYKISSIHELLTLLIPLIY